MSNPILPFYEHIPDGEPRLFGNRVYLYGSHDRPNSDTFCDYKLKVWSADVNNLNSWQCHGDIFHTVSDEDHTPEVEWTDHLIFAPDVVEKDGKYYLYSYIFDAKGAVGVSDNPEGPFKVIGQYIYDEADAGDNGIFNDAGVLVDDDGRVYIYYGFERSFMGEINPENMHEIIKGSLKVDVIPTGKEDNDFFEASSPRKINGKYYLFYSGRKGSRLYYAISDAPTGPFERKGYIIDNGDDFPGGNNHGSVCFIDGQWYIFYHRMTNGSIMSRRACADRIEFDSDGTIKPVKMTSMGFENALNPYYPTKAQTACVLKGGPLVTYKDEFTQVLSNIQNGSIIGYRDFDFGKDFSSKTMEILFKVIGMGCASTVSVYIDDYENGEKLGEFTVGTGDGVYGARIKNVTGRHAVFFKVEHNYTGWFVDAFKGRNLFELSEFVFKK